MFSPTVRPQGALVLLTAAFVVLAALLIAPRAEAASIYACQKKKGGNVRIVGSKTKCKKSEKKLSWSTTGTAGSNGSNGSNGTNGTNGTNGAPGSNGTNGTNGAAGPSNGYIDKPSQSSLDGTDKVIATLTLPAGKYIVSGKVIIQRGGVGGETDCYLRLDGTSIDSFYNILAASPNPGYVGGLAGLASIATTATSTVTMTCRDVATTAIAAAPVLSAIKVATLN